MRTLCVLAVAALALAACKPKAETARGPAPRVQENQVFTVPPASTDAGSAAGGPPSGAPIDDTILSLTEDDNRLATGQYYDSYPLPVASGQTIFLTVDSSEFRPVVVILDPDRQKVSESTIENRNADGSWTLDVEQQFEDGGNYYALIAAQDVGAMGRYTVRMRRGGPAA